MVKWPILIHIGMAVWYCVTAYYLLRDAIRQVRNSGREEWELEEGLPP